MCILFYQKWIIMHTFENILQLSYSVHGKSLKWIWLVYNIGQSKKIVLHGKYFFTQIYGKIG